MGNTGTVSTALVPNAAGFTQDQLLWLEQAYPECTDVCDEKTMYVRLGQRQVIKRVAQEIDRAIRKNTRGF